MKKHSKRFWWECSRFELQNAVIKIESVSGPFKYKCYTSYKDVFCNYKFIIATIKLKLIMKELSSSNAKCRRDGDA